MANLFNSNSYLIHSNRLNAHAEQECLEYKKKLKQKFGSEAKCMLMECHVSVCSVIVCADLQQNCLY